MELVLYPDPVLRKKTEPIKTTSRRIKKVVSEMFDIMYRANGIGLAAPQAGLLLKIFIASLPNEKTERRDEYVFINPSITSKNGMTEFEEGCLSFPEINGRVMRPETVRVKFMTLKGKTFTIDAGGLLARVIQHENDHLNGVLFIDKVIYEDKIKIKPQLLKLESSFNDIKTPAGAVL